MSHNPNPNHTVVSLEETSEVRLYLTSKFYKIPNAVYQLVKVELEDCSYEDGVKFAKELAVKFGYRFVNTTKHSKA